MAASSPTLGFILSETGEEDVTIIIPESDYNVVKMLLQYIYHGEVITVDKLKSELETFMLDWVILRKNLNNFKVNLNFRPFLHLYFRMSLIHKLL